MKLRLELCIPAPLLFLYPSGKLLDGRRVGLIAPRITYTEFVVSAVAWFIRCSQFGELRASIWQHERALLIWKGKLLPLSEKRWDAIRNVGRLRLLFLMMAIWMSRWCKWPMRWHGKLTSKTCWALLGFRPILVLGRMRLFHYTGKWAESATV